MVTPKGSMSTEGEALQVSVLPYRCSICPPLVTRQMSNLAILANFKTQNAFLFPVHAMFRHDCPLAVKPASTPRRLVHKKKTWRDSLPIDMLLSAVSILVVAQPCSEIPEGVTNYPVYIQGEHKVFPWLQTFITRKLRGIKNRSTCWSVLMCCKKKLLALSYILKKIIFLFHVVFL